MRVGKISYPEILAAALGYTESSPQWPIIPLGATTKRPTIRTGDLHRMAMTTDPDVIRDWHRRGLLQAIGTPTGSTSAVVVDVDNKHGKNGDALLAELEQALGVLPRTRVARTQSGGLHIYCAHPGVYVSNGAGEKSQLGKLLCGAPGIDVRGDGGLVVLPPSAGYSWLVDDEEPLQPIPPMWLAAIRGAGEEPRISRSRSSVRETSDDARIKRARAYLATMDPSIEGQGGHDALWLATVRMMHGFELDDATTRELIAGDFNARCSPPWSDKEIDHKIKQARRAQYPERFRVEDRSRS